MSTTVFDLMAKLGLDSSEYESGLKKSKSIGESFGKGLATAAKVGLTAVGAATTAITAFGAASVKTGSAFDKSMSQVAATMGKTMDEMQNEVGSVTLALNGQTKEFTGTLRDFAQEMGKNTAFSATQAADALNYMALAGYDTQTSMNMLPNVLNLAAAGSMDLARASDMVTDTQTAFGISLERTSQMVDEMAKAASTGNTSVEQLGDAFLTVGGLTRELNGGVVILKDGTEVATDGVQELEIALTAMANAGIKGSEAGTHMRNMLLKLSSPTDEGAKQMEALGVSVFDTEGKMRSLDSIFFDLNDSLSKLTQEEKIQAISDLFNTRDLASAEALLNAINSDWDKIGASILDAEGAASEMAKTQLDNLAGDVTLFKSALEGAQIAVSDVLSPALREFVQFGTSGLSQLTDAFQKDGLSGAIDVFGEVLSEGLTMIIGKMPEFIDAGLQLLGALGQGLSENIDVITEAGIQIVNKLLMAMVDATTSDSEAGSSVLKSIADAIIQDAPTIMYAGFTILQNVIQGIVNNIPALVTCATELIKSFGEFLIRNLPTLISSAAEMVVSLAEGLSEALPELIPVAIDAILTFVDAVLGNLDKLLDAAINMILALADGLINALPNLIERLPDIIEKVVSTLITLSPKLLVAAIELIMQLQVGLIKSIPVLVKALPEIIAALIVAIGDLAVELVESGKELIEQVKAGFLSINPKEWGADLIDNFVQGIKNGVAKVKEAATSVASTIKSILGFSEPEEGPLSDFHTYAPDMMDLFAKGISDGEGTVKNQLTSAFDFSSMITKSTAIISKLSTAMVTGWQTIWSTLTSKSSESLGNLIQVVGQKMSEMVQVSVQWLNIFLERGVYFATSFVTKFTATIATIISKLTKIWNDVINSMKDFGSKFVNDGLKFAKSFADTFVEAFSGMSDKMAEIGKNIVEGLKTGIKNSWTALTDWIKELADKLVKSFKDNLKIKSPSRLFADEVGKYIPLGIAMGIEENAGSLYKSIDNLTSGITTVDNPIRTSVDGLSKIIGSASENQNITVQVVLEGDADRLFRVMQAKANKNYALTGNAGLVTV